MSGTSSQRPIISFDLDGVICRPPFGLNVAIRRGLQGRLLPASPPEAGGHHRTRLYLVRLGLEALRFAGRRPMPDAVSGLRAAAEVRRPILVTGRSAVGRALLERWLDRYDLLGFFAEILPNATTLSSSQYKLWTARSRSLQEHVDDDGATVYYLATNGVPHVYLRDWPRNRGLPYPSSVRVLRSLDELAEHLAHADAAGGLAQDPHMAPHPTNLG